VVKEDSDWFEETWRYRDNVLYPQLFGGVHSGSIVTIPHVAFTQLGVELIDPRWLHCGVLTFPPTPKRTDVVFMTSGLSNAWNDGRPNPSSASGLGIELRLDNASDEYWAKDILLRLSAMQLLIAAGHFGGARLLADGDRVRVGAESFGTGSAMTALLATRVADFELASGTFGIMQLFAISDTERQFAATHGNDALVAALREGTTYPVNDIGRRSVV
jgi:hypothetical protein